MQKSEYWCRFATNYYRKKRGFTLIESLTVLFIFALITLAFYGVFSLGLNHIIESKNRLGAASLANEKMEIARNLDYDDLGTKRADGSGYGVLAGEISDYETVIKNTRQYYVLTTVSYVDDEFDHKQGASPGDAIPNDYKKVRIKVAWENDIATNKAVVLVSTFPPNGIETAIPGTGSLSINIMDNSGTGISNATLHITNSETSTNMTVTTDSSGNYTLIGAAQSNQKYKIDFTKNEYYSVSTLLPYPNTSYNPTDVHASVMADAMSPKTIITDRSSSFTLFTKDPFGNIFSDIEFDMKGGRIMGKTATDPPLDVYAWEGSFNTNTCGESNFSDMSSGIYYPILKNEPGYQILKISPAISINKDAFDLLPGVGVDFDVILMDKSISSVLINVVRNESDPASPIEGASVRLINTGLSYDKIISSDAYGQAYFPDSLPALSAAQYEIQVTADGFSPYTGTVDVSGSLVVKEVKLTPL